MDRFELIIATWEIANAFSELIDPTPFVSGTQSPVQFRVRPTRATIESSAQRLPSRRDTARRATAVRLAAARSAIIRPNRI